MGGNCRSDRAYEPVRMRPVRTTPSISRSTSPSLPRSAAAAAPAAPLLRRQAPPLLRPSRQRAHGASLGLAPLPRSPCAAVVEGIGRIWLFFSVSGMATVAVRRRRPCSAPSFSLLSHAPSPPRHRVAHTLLPVPRRGWERPARRRAEPPPADALRRHGKPPRSPLSSTRLDLRWREEPNGAGSAAGNLTGSELRRVNATPLPRVADRWGRVNPGPSCQCLGCTRSGCA
jgi:hypothetical protein